MVIRMIPFLLTIVKEKCGYLLDALFCYKYRVDLIEVQILSWPRFEYLIIRFSFFKKITYFNPYGSSANVRS